MSADKDGVLSVDVSPITFYNAAAIRELNEKLENTVKAKDAELKVLQDENVVVKKRLAELEAKDRERDSRLGRLEEILAHSAKGVPAVFEINDRKGN